MSKLAHSNAYHSNPGDRCEGCEAFVDPADLSVEAFEVTGKVLCGDCADDALHGESE